MPVAYVDSSAIIAVGFNESRADEVRHRLTEFDSLVSSTFLEAEVRSAFAREGLAFNPSVFAGIEWLFSGEPLSKELGGVLAAGYLRGADLWHLAVALFTFPDPGEVAFLTLDNRQRAVAATLGFQV